MAFKILTVDFLSENAPKNFVRSLKDTGFAIIKNHPISKSLLNKPVSTNVTINKITDITNKYF